MEVDLGGAGVLVAEPEGDDGEVDAGLQEPHGARVTQHVRGDLLVGQRRTGGGGGGDVAVYDPSDGVAGEGPSDQNAVSSLPLEKASCPLIR